MAPPIAHFQNITLVVVFGRAVRTESRSLGVLKLILFTQTKTFLIAADLPQNNNYLLFILCQQVKIFGAP